MAEKYIADRAACSVPQCGQLWGMMPMAHQPTALSDMIEAEHNVRQALAGKSPGKAMSALLTLYRTTPDSKREPLIAVLATRIAAEMRNHLQS